LNTPLHSLRLTEDSSGIQSPQKPVNLLPEIPTPSARKLTEREQRDCEVIGRVEVISLTLSVIMDFIFLSRAPYSFILLYCSEEHPGLRAQSNNAFSGQFCQGSDTDFFNDFLWSKNIQLCFDDQISLLFIFPA